MHYQYKKIYNCVQSILQIESNISKLNQQRLFLSSIASLNASLKLDSCGSCLTVLVDIGPAKSQ